MRKYLFWLTALTAVSLYAQDPPSRVARLNFLQGSVSFQPGTLDEWSAASLNYPLTTGDHLYTDRGSRAELQAGGAAIRLDGGTDLTILNLDDRTLQISVTSGAVNLRVRRFYAGDVVEVDTPNGAVSLTRAGEYRVDTDPNRNATMVTVMSGEAEMFNSGESFPVHARQTGFFNDDGSAQVDTANPPDSFDSFAYARDRREDAPPPPYVSREMIGYQDLQEYGTWRDVSDYGPVWVPRVNAGWAPYREGHWAWVAPWGWTWVDDAPWGFAPFHYGRWAYLGDTWGWVPGPVVSRPVYAPALVAFVGGNNWGVSLGLGGGGGVGWFPLGPRDVYVPSYHVSRNYVNQVNITNVRNINIAAINNISNFRNVTYMNQSVPNAVTAMSRQDFASSRPVRQVAVPVPMRALMGSQIINNAPIAPQRVSVLGGQSRANIGFVRPPATVNARPVFVRNAPPPAPVPFAVRQQAEAATPGRPLDPATLQRLQQSAPVQRSVQVRPVTAMPARPQMANPSQPGFNQQRPGNVPQQQMNVPFTRQQGAAGQQAAPQNPNFDRMRQQNSSAPLPFNRPPSSAPAAAPPQAPNSNADAERQRQLMLDQQRQQQMRQNPNVTVPFNRPPAAQPQQPQAQPNADAERQRQLMLDQQRQQQMRQNPNVTVPFNRPPAAQPQQPQAQPNADAERQRQLMLDQQRQQQMRQNPNVTVPFNRPPAAQPQQPQAQPNPDAERQRQLMLEQQRQQQMRQNPSGQAPYTRQSAAPSPNPQPNADAERQRQMQLQRQQQIDQQRQQQLQRPPVAAPPDAERQRQMQLQMEQQRQMQAQRQQQLEQQRQQQLREQRQPPQQTAPPRAPQNQRPAPPPDPKRDEKPKDEKKPNNQGF